MSLDYFEIERGLQIANVVFITGAGAPPGTGDSSTAGIGSQWLDSTNGHLYVKQVAGAGAGNWTRQALLSELGNNTSWREPVKVADLVATSLPTATPTNPITVDGISITDGQRVLFAAISGGNGPNIYTYTQSAGTFAEDVNPETAGDAVYVELGTSAGKTFAFNGTIWVQSNQSNLDEEGYLRAFVGKSAAGNVLPTYSGTNYITNGDSLQTAVGKLDVQLKTTTTDLGTEITNRGNADSTLQGEIDFIETGAGLNANGTYTADGGADYISSATSLKNADSLLDDQIKTNADNIGTVTTTANNAAAAIAKERTETSAIGVTAVATIDSVLVDNFSVCRWFVYCEGNAGGDAAKKAVVEILATHDGTAAADATDTDYTTFAKLKMGTLAGLVFTVDVSGTGAAQVMRLRVASTTSVNVKAIRAVIV